ncbi:hypothetical protein [Bosea vestrisii]|jgi:hypothetical protein|uniref:Uncharacterized protein n=1 Tax=Bosea vestrisii TaxID=151416 RepID=A0ABW0HGF4_9HYPH
MARAFARVQRSRSAVALLQEVDESTMLMHMTGAPPKSGSFYGAASKAIM